MPSSEQSALWARVSSTRPAFPTRDSLQLALSRAEHERAKLAESVRQLGQETQAWRADLASQRDGLQRLEAQVTAISRRLQRVVTAAEDQKDAERDALASLHDSSADLVDAVRSHTQRSLHELAQLRDELREASDTRAWRTRFALVGCFAACAISLAAWAGAGASPQVAAPAEPTRADTAAPLGSTVLAGYRRPR